MTKDVEFDYEAGNSLVPLTKKSWTKAIIVSTLIQIVMMIHFKLPLWVDLVVGIAIVIAIYDPANKD